MSALALRVQGLSKRFGGTQALADVSLDLAPGACLAVLGQNGAGKSTLIKILSGVYRADRGAIQLHGRPAQFASPAAALAAGIALVPQDLQIVPDLSVAENVMLGQLPVRRLGGLLPVVDRTAMAHAAVELTASLGLEVDPRRSAGSLSFAERQLLVIARALGHRADVLILDEPTASLEQREVGRLFEALAALKRRRVAIIYISHRLEEVEAIADAVLVLRDGRVTARMDQPPFDNAAIVLAMTGRAVGHTAAPAHEPSKDMAAEIAVGSDRVACRRGEVVGLGGLLGAGGDVAVRTAFGHDRRAVRRAIASRRGYVPPERGIGLVPALSVRDNIVLPHLDRFRSVFGRDDRRIDAAVRELIASLDIRPADPWRPVRALSGGNQQKVALARWLVGRLDLLLLDEPTQGVDVGAKAQIHARIQRIAADGAGVVLSSSDEKELLSLSHVVYGLRRGQVIGRLERGPGYGEAALRRMLGLTR